jgi:hypothetical protein
LFLNLEVADFSWGSLWSPAPSTKPYEGVIWMSNSMKTLLAGAALAGLMTGTRAKLEAQTQDQGSHKAGIKFVSFNETDAKKEKHACKGQNSCKGKGGCKTGDNGCKGKNSCKGKGGCATDGSKPPADSPNSDQN